MKRGISLFLIALFVLIPLASAELSYYHYDLQGNVRHITNSNGNVIEEAKYLPFGERFDSDMKDVHGFTGKELDNSDNYYFNARYQSPQEGRFLTPDTVKPDLENPQSLNLYTYTLNNPIKYIDPSGNQPLLGTGFKDDPFLYPEITVMSTEPWPPKEDSEIKIIQSEVFRLKTYGYSEEYNSEFRQGAKFTDYDVHLKVEWSNLFGEKDPIAYRSRFSGPSSSTLRYEYEKLSDQEIDALIFAKKLAPYKTVRNLADKIVDKSLVFSFIDDSTPGGRREVSYLFYGAEFGMEDLTLQDKRFIKNPKNMYNFAKIGNYFKKKGMNPGLVFFGLPGVVYSSQEHAILQIMQYEHGEYSYSRSTRKSKNYRKGNSF